MRSGVVHGCPVDLAIARSRRDAEKGAGAWGRRGCGCFYKLEVLLVGVPLIPVVWSLYSGP